MYNLNNEQPVIPEPPISIPSDLPTLGAEENKKTWGGARKGAGRKTASEGPLVTIGLTVEATTKAKLKQLAETEGLSMSEYVNRLIKSL
jgi:hypothetical protein